MPGARLREAWRPLARRRRLRYRARPVPMTRTLAAFTVSCILLAAVPVRAQVLSEQVQDNNRICTYAGTETLADGQVVPRTFTVGLGQECPATAPYRDPNAPVPANAALLGERTNGASRFCLYGEGGIEYQVAVAITLRCAMTPALLDRARQNAEQGTAGQDAAGQDER